MVSALLVVQVAALFLLAGLAEIGGGWLIWEAVRGQGRPWYWAAAGGVVLVTYGFIPTLQPLTDFGRLYAAYGGVFIGLSFAWGALVDGTEYDIGDLIGSLVALVGVAIVLFWPREHFVSGDGSPTHASSISSSYQSLATGV